MSKGPRDTEADTPEDTENGNEDPFRAVFGMAPDAIFIMDVDGRFMEANEAACRQLGYPREELLRMSMREIVSLDFRDRLNARLKGALETPGCFESRHVRKDGTEVSVELAVRRMFFMRRPALLGIARDITEQKRIEEALRESERRYKSIFRNASISLWEADISRLKSAVNELKAGGVSNLGAYLAARPELGPELMKLINVVDVNDAMVKLFEVEKGEELLGPMDIDLEPGTLTDKNEIVRLIVESRRHLKFETTIRTMAGKAMDVYISAAIPDETSPHRNMLVNVIDMTERRRAEKAFLASESRYRSLYESMMDGFVSMDMEGRIRECNGAYLQMLGYRSEEIAALGNPDLTPEKWRVFEAGIIKRQVLKRGYSDIYEKEYSRKDGTVIPVELRTILLRDETGKASGMWSIARDISERKRVEERQRSLTEQLTQAQKMESIGRLAGGIAHDFNNILTGIIGNISLALLDLDPMDPMHGTLTEIERAAASAAVLTRRLLSFSRKEIVQPKVIRLNELITGMHKMLERLIGRDMELQPSLSDGLWNVKADPGQIEQIIVNLAVNSRDAMPDGGRLSITTRNVVLQENSYIIHGVPGPGDYVSIEVSDTGCGMTHEVKRHLFEPFFTTKEKGKGTGLGLAMVYGAVQQNHGSIEAESESGRGTVFRIFFPRTKEESVETPAEPLESETPGGMETILLVEDEPPIRKLAVRLLEKLGYRIVPCANGAEALKAVGEYEGPIHLLVTDVVMPGINGRDLAEKLSCIRPDLKVLFTSGYSDDVIGHPGRLETGMHFIGKPFTSQALARKIRRVLDGEG